MKIKHTKTIEEAVDCIEEFFQVDMWYACKSEWKTEKDMLRYLKIHFNVLRKEIKLIKKKKVKDDKEFLREKEIAAVESKERVKILNKQTEELKGQMKETSKALIRMT